MFLLCPHNLTALLTLICVVAFHIPMYFTDPYPTPVSTIDLFRQNTLGVLLTDIYNCHEFVGMV